MIVVRVILIMLVIGLSHCAAHANDITNEPTEPLVRKFGAFTMMHTNGHWIYVNPAEFWSGVWKEGADGWRVQLRVYSETNLWFDEKKGVPIPVSTNLMLSVEWGSPLKNSEGRYFVTPNGKFARFQLLDAQRNVIAPKPSAATNLLERSVRSNMPFEKIRYGTHLPGWVSPEKPSMEAKFPEKISTNAYPFFSNGDMVGETGSATNKPPFDVGFLNLDEVYSVPKEGDYMLVVQPVLYKQNSTNRAVLNRVDLPSVVTKVHLVPKAK